MANSNLDVSLDDLINRNRSSGNSSRTSNHHGPTRRYSNQTANRAAPYPLTAARGPRAQFELSSFAADYAASFPVREGARVIETGTKLLVSNLDYGVTDEDIQELFSAFGELKKCSVNYDRSGNSEGTAEVVYSRRRDAEAAIKSYNNVQLDGRPMKIEIVGSNVASPPVLPPASFAGNRNYIGFPIRNGRAQGRGGAVRQFHAGVGNPRMGGGGARGRRENISAEDLDADLDKYRKEASQAS